MTLPMNNSSCEAPHYETFSVWTTLNMKYYQSGYLSLVIFKAIQCQRPKPSVWFYFVGFFFSGKYFRCWIYWFELYLISIFLTIELPVYCIVWIYIINSFFIFPKSFYFLPEIKLNSMLYFYNYSSTFQMDLLMFIFRSYFPFFFPRKTMIYFLIAGRSIFFSIFFFRR